MVPSILQMELLGEISTAELGFHRFSRSSDILSFHFFFHLS